ncbi:hypothetical protein D0Y65_027184, partial [Glycine soja]
FLSLFSSSIRANLLRLGFQFTVLFLTVKWAWASKNEDECCFLHPPHHLTKKPFTHLYSSGPFPFPFLCASLRSQDHHNSSPPITGAVSVRDVIIPSGDFVSCETCLIDAWKTLQFAQVGPKDHQRFQASYATILKAHMTAIKKRERKDKKKPSKADKREGSSKRLKRFWLVLFSLVFLSQMD